MGDSFRLLFKKLNFNKFKMENEIGKMQMSKWSL